MQEQKEVWLPVKGYEGIYEVSNFGRIKSLSRIIFDKNGIRLRMSKEMLLKQTLGSHGYYFVKLKNNNKSKTITTHCLVAINFLNHTPCGLKVVVDHIDNDRLNNNVCNLRLISHRENLGKVPRGSSKYVGVYWSKKRKKWISRITINKKIIELGGYENELEAKEAYEKELNKIK